MNIQQPPNERAARLPARYQPLALAAAVVSAGIAADRWYPLAIDIWLTLGLLSWLLWFTTRRWKRLSLGTALLGLALAALGGAWHHLRWSAFAADEIGLFARETPAPASIRAVALGTARRMPGRASDPLSAIPRGERCRFLARVVGVRDGDTWMPSSGVTQVWVDGGTIGISAGDRLEIVGQLSSPAGPQNPGEFNYARHSRGDRQLSRISADFTECVLIVSHGNRWLPGRWLGALRDGGHALLWRHIERNRAALASALLLGVREELDDDTSTAFAKTGTIHLLSISGLHVGILAMFLFGILRLGLIGRRLALLGVALVTLGYALVIAAEPPAVRAAIVVLLTSLAMYRWRRWQAVNLLAGAALAVLAMNPCDLFRIGPQLSFLAVATLAWSAGRFAPRPITDPLDRLIASARSWPERCARRVAARTWQSVAVGVCVWGLSVPLVLSQFHLVSPATVLLTPLLAVPVSVALISGFLLLVCGWIASPLAAVLGLVCDVSLWAIASGVDYASSVSWGHLWAPGPPAWWLGGFYAAAAVWSVLPRFCPPRRWCLGCLAGWTSIGLLMPLAQQQTRPRLDCTFLSVGHGCAVLLELPGGEKILYDAGRLGSPTAGARSIAGYLWHRGITRLDAIVLSHADVDHYNAVPELLEKFRVGVVYVTPAMLLDEGEAMRTLLAAIRAAGVPLRETWSGDRLRVRGRCLLEVWHPTRSGVLGGDNANSLVLDVEYHDRRILLTGDLETPGLDDLLAESPCHCDVVLTPHHGSARSNPPGFAAWSTPQLAIVSGSFNDRRADVDRAYRDQGARVLNTADSGAICVSIDEAGLSTTTWKQGPRSGF